MKKIVSDEEETEEAREDGIGGACELCDLP